MWRLYQTATKTGQRPSHLLEVFDQLAAYELDSAVVFFGTAIEALLQETENVGTEEKPRFEQKYLLSDLLKEDFVVDRNTPERVDFTALKKVQGIEIEGL